ncbi:MAG: hypothetical protein JSV63_03980 [Candidatus Aenigmatarchaeota archaeon]|nr:MAG: hypothetical protein JSV63_03980 [Candidatus Aenigmarchaeota archaeon]
MAKKAYRNTSINIIKIFKVLKQAAGEQEGFMTVSEIARRTNMHKWTVSRTLDLYMGPIVDLVQPPELEALGLQVKLVKLNNPELKPEQVISYLKLRSKINP